MAVYRPCERGGSGVKPASVIQVRGISMTYCWERRRPRGPIIESVGGKRRATAYPTVSERTRNLLSGQMSAERLTSPGTRDYILRLRG